MDVVPFKFLEAQIADLLDSTSLSSAKGLTKGLAIFIGCETSSESKHPYLDGVKKDLELLRSTFSSLGFDTVELHDPSKEEIQKVIAMTKGKLYQKAVHFYNSIVVTFSGHGDQTKLFSKNGSLSLMDEIVNPLISEHPLVPKIFFVDACRGDKKDLGVTYSLPSRQDRIRARGEREEINLPQNGNYLLAYSTLTGMKSFENECGSYWIQVLTEELLCNNGKSILDLLTMVNQKLILKFNELHLTLQQPIHVSCLNQVLIFQCIDAKVTNLKYPGVPDGGANQLIQLQDITDEGRPNLDITVPVQLPRQDSHTQQGYYRGVLNLLKQKGIIVGKPIEQDTKNPTNEQQCMYTITAELINKVTVEGKSRYLPKKRAEEEAAKNIYLEIKPYMVCWREGGLTSSSSTSLLRLSPPPELSQRLSSPSKVSPPPTPTASMTRSSTPSKTEKSRLKEYCDQRWKGKEVIYTYTLNSTGCIATATLPNGFQRTGHKKITKKVAENSVAELIIAELNIQ